MSEGGLQTPKIRDMRVAYVLLWFPLASETFIFREISALVQVGLEVPVYTLYGKALKGCSEKMKNWPGPVFRMGSRAFFSVLFAWLRALRKRPAFVWKLMRTALFHKMRNLEAQAENTWSFFAGFLLAEKCVADKVDLIHSAWANGPATAAWIASELSGIPYAFTGRAGDIYPEDGLLREKCATASLVRTNNAANVGWIQSFCPPQEREKVKLVYNSFIFGPKRQPERISRNPPWKILAVGRFVRTKGFPDLLSAMARLKRERFPVELTLVGDGAWHKKLELQIKRQRLENIVHLPGFIPNDALIKYMQSHDLLVVPSVVYENGDRDGIPNVIMEASSLGLPVIATDVCGIGEVVRTGQTGILLPQHRPDLLAHAIRKMLEHRGEARQMSIAAGNLVRKLFDPEQNTAMLLNLYANAISDSRNE